MVQSCYSLPAVGSIQQPQGEFRLLILQPALSAYMSYYIAYQCSMVVVAAGEILPRSIN